jgi:hypothetical protein
MSACELERPEFGLNGALMRTLGIFSNVGLPATYPYERTRPI